MIFSKDRIKAILFDYGNTLIEFGPSQIKVQYAALEKELGRMFGYCNSSHLKDIRDRQALAPFTSGFRENDLKSITEELIREIYNIVPKESQINALIQARYKSFVNVVKLSSDVLQLLKRVNKRYRLGLVSNYPCSRSIQHSLMKLGLSDILEAVVISGDVGYVKPHAKPFKAILNLLSLRPKECVYVGDNWLADVQGAKRMGMYSILIEQYTPYESFDPVSGDHNPDATIKNLNELEELLLR